MIRPGVTRWLATPRVVSSRSYHGLHARVAPRRREAQGWSRFHSISNGLRGTARHLTSQPSLVVEPTIYALSTAPGRAAIAIIRISGPACLEVYHQLCQGKAMPKARQATVRTLYHPKVQASSDSVLDSNALVLYFPSPNTVTGEDVLELHVHGGPAVIKAVLAAISTCNTTGSIRYAEPGEFTRRAFLNDRLDLTQVEALGDTLSATTEQQRKLSIRGTSSKLSQRYESWRRELLYARGELEALIDFSEDQHFDESPSELCGSVSAQVRLLISKLQAHSENAMRGELLRNGITLSFLGAPNVGKSSLLNCIVGRDAAIVSHEAGTTRDIVEVGIDLGGYFCRLGDTAGLRKSRPDDLLAQAGDFVGQVEEEGMRRAKERAVDSDVVVLVLSFERIADQIHLKLDPEVVETAAELVATKKNVIVAINKADLSRDIGDLKSAVHAVSNALAGIDTERIYFTSCKSVDASFPQNLSRQPEASGNIQCFLQGMIEYFADMTAAVTPDSDDDIGDVSIWQDSLGASERHRLLLLQCIEYLAAFLQEADSASSLGEENDTDIVVAAEHLRGAADCLARIAGRGEAGDVEEVLGVVFEKFCVGK